MHDLDKLLGLCGLHFPICSGVLRRPQAELHIDRKTPAGSTSQTAFRGDHPCAQPEPAPPVPSHQGHAEGRAPQGTVHASYLLQLPGHRTSRHRTQAGDLPSHPRPGTPPGTAQRPRRLRSRACDRPPAPDHPSLTARWGRGRGGA